MDKPILLVYKNLIKPIRTARHELLEVETELSKINNNKILQKSLYSYVFSIFEIMLNDSLKYYLSKFPMKIKDKKFEFEKNEFISITDSNELLNNKIEEYVQKLSYKNLREYLKEYCELFSISFNDEDLLDQLIERKATRNLLLHNNLEINKKYTESAGKYARGSYSGKLALEQSYIEETIDYIKKLAGHLENELHIKYAQFTKVRALKSLWEYLFESPVMKFDDFWETISDNEVTLKIKNVRPTIKLSCSGSERRILAVWLIHFNQNLHKMFHPVDFLTYSLDNKRKDNLAFLMSVILNDADLFKT